MSVKLASKSALQKVLGFADTDEAVLMSTAAEVIAQHEEEIELLRKEVARLDKLSTDLHASKVAAIVEQTKSRDRALVAERKVKALRTALLVLTDPEDA